MTPSLTPKLERFTGQEAAVAPDAIEKELAALWQQAGESRGGPAAVTRACLWNVVAHLPQATGAEGAAGAKRLATAINQLPLHLASRTLLLQTSEAEEGQPALDSFVSANCILAEGGGKLVCSEEVTLIARGDGARHLPGLVRALLVPGVPTAFVIAGVPDLGDELVEDMVAASDRVVFDLDASTLERPLDAAAAAMAQCRLQGLDLGWLRRSTLRAEVASLFDPPVTAADIEAVRRVVLTAGPQEASTARVLLGWVLSSLGGRSTVCTGPARWQVERAKAGPLEVWLDLDDSGGLRIDFFSDQGPTRSVRCGERVIATGCGTVPERSGRPERLEALIARALATRGDDAAFLTAIEEARRL